MTTQMEQLARTPNLDLDKKHELYFLVQKVRKKARDLYSGEHVVKELGKDYLVQLPKETDKTFNRRLLLAVFDNWVLVVILYRLSLQWRQAPQRVLPAIIAALEFNVNQRGMDANTFFRGVNEDSSVDGLRWVLVDKNKRPIDPETGQRKPATSQAEENDPYAVSISGQCVFDWSFGSDQLLEWAVVVQDQRIQPGPGQKPIDRKLRMVWTRDEWGLFEHQKTWEARIKTTQEKVIAGGAQGWFLVDQGENPLKRVPLVPFYGSFVVEGYGLPVIKDVLGLQIALYNKSSLRDKAEINACNVIMWAISPEKPDEIQIGEDSAAWLSSTNLSGAVAPAQFGILEAAGTGIEACRRTEDNYIGRILQTGALQAHGRLPTGQVQSAESIKAESNQFSSSLVSVAEHLEASEIEVWRLFYLHKGGSNEEFDKLVADKERPIVSYNKDFDQSSLSDEMLKILLQARQAGSLSLEAWIKALNSSRRLPFDLPVEQEIASIEADRDREGMPGFQQENPEIATPNA
jgi:hypothetical protein